MNKYDIALKVGVVSFIAMLIIVVSMNHLSSEITSHASGSGLAQVLGLVLSITVSCCGLFLWFTGFKRFHNIIGTYGFKWLIYVTFTIFSGFYMQFRYGSETPS